MTYVDICDRCHVGGLSDLRQALHLTKDCGRLNTVASKTNQMLSVFELII